MTKTTTLIKHRYKPVSEFDEVTLASKREYWRTKKREQRARLSKARKKVRAPITEVCKPVCTDGHVSQKSNREFSPASLNSDGSYQSNVAQNQTKGVVIYKKMTNEESNMDASVDKQNGGPLTKGLPLPAACIKVHTNSITPQQTQNRSSAINGNLLSISASKLAPKCSKQASQIKCRVTPSAKSSAFVECKFDNDQRIRARTNTTSNAVASGPLCSMVVCKTAEMAMTEEERVAKRRENWRIKKREQRAKRAEKLKINREKMQWFEKGRQETGRFSRAAPAHSLSSVNTMALRKGKQRNSVMSVDPRLSAGKPLNYGVSVEKVKLSQSPYTPQSVALKLAERQRLLAKNLSSVSGYSRNQIQTLKQNHIAISSAVSMQPLRSTQAIGQSRIPQQKFVRIQRMKVLPQGNETAEERLAKQREYWRIKKREQRAKRSLALKGRLKDRDAFNWRAKRYQFIMEQIRKTPTGLQKMPQSNKNTLLDNPNYGNHFIKGDGTVNMSISQTTAEKVSPAISSTLSVVKSSSDSPMAQRLIQIRDRPVLHSIPNSTNLSANQRRTRRSTFKDITACAPVVVSKLASDTKDAKIPLRSSEATQTEQLVPVYRTTFKEELESCDSCSAVTPGLELTSCDSTKQEQMYPSIAMVCSLTEQNQTVNIKEINSAPPPENNGEAEPCSTNESQSTTLLVVASMKKLLEESLSSVGESNGTSVDKGALLPCKTEGESFPQEEKEMDRKAELAQPQEFPTDTYSSVVAIQSPSPCHSPLQMHDFSSDSPDLSCRDALLQPSCTASCLNKSPGDERCELPVAACVTPLHSGNSVLSGKTSGPQWNIPPQVHGFQQLNENSELQKKREYWRVMKRQQRARKAKEMEKGKDALPPFQRKYGSSQVHHLPVAQKINHISLENPVILPNVTSRPARPVLSPAALSNQQPSNETRQLLYEVQKGKTMCSEVCQVNKRQLQCRGNVLSSATRPGTMTSMLTNHVKLSDSRIQTRGSSMSKFNRTPSQLKIMPNQELELDEATQRKRMHWRIKKQEQRARKAAREKELNHQTAFNQSRHSWSNNITDVVQSIPPERLDYMPADECQTMAVKDEAETCYLPDDDCLDEPLSEDKWRSIYLMDFDPVNQLLVCMVCGEQQYTFSVEEVRAHIEETHPGTLSLEKAERQRILEAWDEQVAVRERFFTNQLWQNSSVIKEQSSRHTAEIEVILGQDDKADQLK